MTKIKNIKNVNIHYEYIKASRHGEWLAINENATGFVSIDKAHKSKKTYNRKNKHRNEYL